jgi:sulfite reductase alpha subunit-like flavoprotein
MAFPDSGDQKKRKLPFPTPITIRSVLTHFCDFQGILMKKVLKDMAKIASPDAAKRLEYLTSSEGKIDFKHEIEEQKRTLFDLLK